MKIRIDDVKVFDTAVNVGEAMFKLDFLFCDFLVKEIKLQCPIVDLLRGPPDEEAKITQDDHGPAAHVGIHVAAPFRVHDICDNLIGE